MKTWQIFILGVVGSIAVLLLPIYQGVLLAAVAGFIIALVLFGFLLPHATKCCMSGRRSSTSILPGRSLPNTTSWPFELSRTFSICCTFRPSWPWDF
jgi:hypothetical protein